MRISLSYAPPKFELTRIEETVEFTFSRLQSKAPPHPMGCQGCPDISRGPSLSRHDARILYLLEETSTQWTILVGRNPVSIFFGLHRTRRPILVAWLVLFAGFDASAQFSAGATTGLFRANLWGDKPSNSSYQSIFTVLGAGTIEYRFSSEFSLTLQPGFSKGGSNVGYKPPLGGGEVLDSVSVRLSYLMIPLLARVVTKGAFFVTTGPVFGSLLSASSKLEGSVESTDIKDRFESGNLGVAFGVGKLIPKDDFTAVIEFRVVWGLANIGITAADQTRVRTGGQQLIVGGQYTFGD
jgi:hypothetical protein